MPRREPEFFVDRSLGRHVVPAALQERGIKLHLMHRVYKDREEELEDPEWIRDCGRNGWFILSKDKSLREDVGRHKLRQFSAGAFVLGAGQLTGEEQAARLVRAMPEILEICEAKRRPFLYVVHRDQVVHLWPPPRVIQPDYR